MKPRTLRSLTALSIVAGLAATCLSQTAAELSAKATNAYQKKQFGKSAHLYLEAYKKDPKALVNLYNAACSLALDGKADEAFKALDELVTKGYNLPEQIKNDTDFTSLRTDARWEKIISAIEENAKKNPPKAMWKKPYEVLTDTPPVADLEAKLGSEDAAVWLDGEVLTFLKRSKSDTVQLAGGVQDAMKKIEGTDLWILRVKMANWEDAFVTYFFIEGKPNSVQFKTWKGKNAPEEPKRAVPLAGTVKEITFHSKALNEDRKLYIYLPPDGPKSDLPAVFLADGAACRGYAQVLEPLILEHKVRPCAIVGIDNGGTRGTDDYRALEYLNGFNADRFAKHMKFFTDEVGAYVAKEFGISTKRENRAVTGFSNGGAFAASVAFHRPDFFGVSMPLSLGVPPDVPIPANLPRIYFAGGTLEPFGAATNSVYEKVKAAGHETSIDFYVAGHDPNMWEMAFVKLIQKAFPPVP